MNGKPGYPSVVISDGMIDDYLDYLVAAGFTENTITSALAVLHRIDRDLPMGLPVALHQELVSWLATDGTLDHKHRPEWSVQSRKTYRGHLVRFYQWASNSDDPRITYDPSVGIPCPRVPAQLPRPATDDQARVACTRTAWPYQLHCVLAAHAGLRPCEIARLYREDVTEHWLTVWQGKGRKSRRVPTHRDVWTLVEGLPAGPVTQRPGGEVATAKWVSQRTAAILHRRHRLPITLYNLRHWYGTMVQVCQGDIRVTQELMGHASPVTTAGYTQVTDARLCKAVDALPSLLK